MKKINDLVINIATVNGSGSQSANLILLKSLFRSGIPVGGRNVFPSNIAGLPTWFWIRANEKNYINPRKQADIVVSLNPQTVLEDQNVVVSGGYFFYSDDLKFDVTKLRNDVSVIALPIKKIVDQATTQIKVKKMLANIVYVGVLSELLNIDKDSLDSSIKDQFKGKQSVWDLNQKALRLGQDYARENLSVENFKFEIQKRNFNDGKILLDGNLASALGLIYGGATFAAWYPITPSSSVMENFENYIYRVRKSEKNNFAVLQAEDELSAICMVLGAGWAGARAFTATSGPGISLMQEAAGYSYFAEIPAVIWNVQRVGPSTGLPTRTSQGDLMSAFRASHGDTFFPVLIPGNVEECFEFGQTCFDLSEKLQQLVFVLSDLELGMNLWTSKKFSFPEKSFDRGEVLSETDLANVQEFSRYHDTNQDGIAARTIPGTRHPLAAYTTRGTGHNVKALYTEKGADYKQMMDRLKLKWKTAESLVPAPIVRYKNSENNPAKIGFIYYGSVESAIIEAEEILLGRQIQMDFLRLRALPLTEKVRNFISQHEVVFILDQNRDGQMTEIIQSNYPSEWSKLNCIKHYDGTPVTADFLTEEILERLNHGK